MKIKLTTWFADTLLVIAEFIGMIILGFIVFPTIAVCGFIWTFIKHVFIKWDYSAKKHFKPLFRAISLVSDCGANACGGEMLNDIMNVKEGEIRYGWFQQTISSVTGLRLIFNNRDSRLRKSLNIFEKDHCIKAPTEMELFYYENKK